MTSYFLCAPLRPLLVTRASRSPQLCFLLFAWIIIIKIRPLRKSISSQTHNLTLRLYYIHIHNILWTHTRHRKCILVNSELLGTDQQTPNWRRCVPLYKLRMQTLHYDTLLMTETEEVLFSLLISLDRVTLIEKSYLKPCWSQLQKKKPAIHWAKVSTSRLNSAFVPCLSFLL